MALIGISVLGSRLVAPLSRTQTLITHISRLCQEIRDIKRQNKNQSILTPKAEPREGATLSKVQEERAITGGRGGITQGVSFEFFESFLLICSHNTHWVNFEFFQKLLTTLIKTYPLGNF